MIRKEAVVILLTSIVTSWAATSTFSIARGTDSPQKVARMIDQIRSEKAPAIFASEVFPSGVVNQKAKEGNVKGVETLSDDDLPGDQGEPEHSYVGMMLENMKNMLVPLGGNIMSLNDVDPRDTS